MVYLRLRFQGTVLHTTEGNPAFHLGKGNIWEALFNYKEDLMPSLYSLKLQFEFAREFTDFIKMVIQH